MLVRCLAELVDQAVRRVEGSSRALRDIGDPRTAELPLLRFWRPHQVDAVEDDRAAGKPAAVAGEAHGSEPDRRLAGTRLADQAHHLALVQGQIDPVDDLRPVLTDLALDPQAAHLE